MAFRWRSGKSRGPKEKNGQITEPGRGGSRHCAETVHLCGQQATLHRNWIAQLQQKG
jgi:hypothetical protein